MKSKSILSISSLLMPLVTATGMLRASSRLNSDSGRVGSRTNDESDYKRRLKKPACNDGTCRKQCIYCPPDSSGVPSQECTACLAQPATTITPSTTTTSSIIKVACILDSLSDEDCCGVVYPPFLQTYLDSTHPGTFEVQEFARWATTICESSHSGNAYKDRLEYLYALDYKPDYIIIWGGLNDSKSGYWDGLDCKSVFQDHAAALYEDFLSLGSVVFVAEPPVSTHTEIRDVIVRLEIVPMIHQAASTVGAIEIPVYDFTKTHTAQAACGQASCNCIDCWFDDGVHFNQQGAEAIANYFGGFILDQCALDGKCSTSTSTTSPASTAASTAASTCRSAGECFKGCHVCCNGFSNNEGIKTCF